MKTDLDTKYYYIINSDLKMSKGKIAAQVSHVAMQLGKVYDVIGSAIVLKATEEELLRLLGRKEMIAYSIRDAGLTEVPEGSLTCIGFIEKSFTREITKELKLV